MAIKRIKIAYQQQVRKPIYLLATGVVECGNFKYTGRYKEKFKSIFMKICDLVHRARGVDEFDVSEYKYWDAINIYNDYVLARWVKSVSAKQIEKLAIETEVKMVLEDIREEFIRALGLKWKRIFRASDPNDPKTPRNAWQLL